MSGKLLNLTFDISEIDKTFNDMSAAFKKAAVNTLNKVGRGANRQAATFIKSQYNIPAKALKIGDKVKLIRADARKDFVSFIIRVIQSRRGLMLYGATQTARGVSVRVKKTAKTIPGAFISTWSRGDKDKFVFTRDPKVGFYRKPNSKLKSKPREKRRMLLGPSVADLYGSSKVKFLINKAITDNFKGELDGEFNSQFEKRR